MSGYIPSVTDWIEEYRVTDLTPFHERTLTHVMANQIKFTEDDGGRKEAGFKGDRAGDCVARAIAIASGRPYREVYDALAYGNATQRITKRTAKTNAGKRTARNGIYTTRKWFKDYMHSLGFVYRAAMGIGTGCTVHLRTNELPQGRLVVSLSRHMAAVIDGVLHDTYDCSRSGTRCVYGYWIKIKE